jgi:hypothetical protein
VCSHGAERIQVSLKHAAVRAVIIFHVLFGKCHASVIM